MSAPAKSPPNEPAEPDPMPTRDEVDAIAHFVEAVRELKQSPFFIEEYSSLKLSMKEGATRHQVTAHFPEPSVMNGVLVPFRRVWQQNEPCNFTRVSNTLKKYIPFFRSFIAPLALDRSKDAVNLFPAWKNEKLSYQDLIDVWLNTRYLHVGRSINVGKFDRSDFERFQGKIGTVLFEYYFILAVLQFGFYFFEIKPFAEGFISDLAQRGLEPSFSMISTKSGEYVRRATPGFTPEHESPAHRVWCLCRRNKFAAFTDFLKIAGHADQHAADLIIECNSFDQFAARSEIDLTYQPEFDLSAAHEFNEVRAVIDTHLTAVRNHRCRKGLIVKKDDGSVILSAEALPIISEQYTDFRRALQKNPFE
jgi:hypothetical protein